ncbi:MAG: hypothetical protein ACTHMJ_19845 [Thermomicrobiales bacterium]
MAATIGRAELARMVDALTGQPAGQKGAAAAAVRALGIAPGSRDYANSLRAVQRGTSPTAKERHEGLTTRTAAGRALADLAPDWVTINASLNRWQRAHPGQQPENVMICGEYIVSNDTRDRCVNFHQPDAAGLAVLRQNVGAFIRREIADADDLVFAAITIS